MKKHKLLIVLLLLGLIIACQPDNGNQNTNSELTLDGEFNFLTDYEPLNADGDLNAVIEIPTGTNDKWEVNKATGNIDWEIVDNQPRVVNYLSYPGNYGMVPQTLLSKEDGGDGDPLDVLVLGPAVERGTVLKCKLIGILKLVDGGEQDDKLIAVGTNSSLYEVNSIGELEKEYAGVTNIISLWFANYKGKNKMEALGYQESDSARIVLQKAIDAYKANN